MATFCSQCGRELKDGEVCNCTQNVQEDGNKWDSTMPSAMPGTGYTDNINFAGNRNVPLFITNLKRILKNPVETASSLVAVKDTDILKGIWILNIIMLFLWVFICQLESYRFGTENPVTGCFGSGCLETAFG